MVFEAKPRVHKRVWLMFQKSMGVLVGGNHTSSRFCTRLVSSFLSVGLYLSVKSLKSCNLIKNLISDANFVVKSGTQHEFEGLEIPDP